ncbi:hypothetical protein RB653_005397 [Dictyostelium firmibasis]|uniref:DNA replication licensing factor MCM3 n=1 Tax=Dictyostelium firmibasis TaxID=79012 RepID=A0AAN7U7L5_9MYCE
MISNNNDESIIMERDFSDFIDDDRSGYRAALDEYIENNSKRLIIKIDILRSVSPDLTQRFLKKPLNYIGLFQNVLTIKIKNLKRQMFEKMLDMDPDDVDEDLKKQLKDTMNQQVFIGFEGNFGSCHVTPRGLNASLITKLVCVEGIVTKCSLVRPKVLKSVHYCEKTKRTTSRTYEDATSDSGIPTTSQYPTRDDQGNPLITEYGMCEYKDSQMVSIQEMPERAPAGQLPRSVDILLDNDLVDTVKPGDRVQVYGVYRAIPMSAPELKTTKFRPILICNKISLLSKEVSGPSLSEQDVTNIKNFSKYNNCFDLLATSLAPSIYGHDNIKRSLLLLLLGGVERNLANGTHLRGDINLLMVGDPSTAKSQLLRFILNIAPLAINTTGRGSSGVGLTAAVTSDSETGERRLEAGAMVLADRGIVCIDEFDKMSPDDRVAIHEVMEQQTVTISKAGIHASLNARCSVVAAANPIYGKYNTDLKAHTNIGLPDSLLSRFDLLFIVLDSINPDHDRMISEHVLRMHRYKDEGSELETMLGSEQISTLGGELKNVSSVRTTSDLDTPVFQKYNRLLHGAENNSDIVSIPFIQKYIFYAKTLFKPRLTDDAREYIIEKYTEMRSKQTQNSIPITTRSLETMIRLSQAHAKCRLDHNVTIDDAVVAIEIMNRALSDSNMKEREKSQFTQNQNQNKRNNNKKNNSKYDDNDEIDDDQNNDDDNDDNDDNNDNNDNEPDLNDFENENEEEYSENDEDDFDIENGISKNNNNNNNNTSNKTNNNNSKTKATTKKRKTSDTSVTTSQTSTPTAPTTIKSTPKPALTKPTEPIQKTKQIMEVGKDINLFLIDRKSKSTSPITVQDIIDHMISKFKKEEIELTLNYLIQISRIALINGNEIISMVQ